jgi:hypothetical protein
MTAEGRQFLAADINTRKQLLNATLRGLFVFDLVVQALKQSANNEVDEAAVLSQLRRRSRTSGRSASCARSWPGRATPNCSNTAASAGSFGDRLPD